jgi:hypothetical protein
MTTDRHGADIPGHWIDGSGEDDGGLDVTQVRIRGIVMMINGESARTLLSTNKSQTQSMMSGHGPDTQR